MDIEMVTTLGSVATPLANTVSSVGHFAEFGSSGLLVGAVVFLINRGGKMMSELRKADRETLAFVMNQNREMMTQFSRGMALAQESALAITQVTNSAAVSLKETAAILERSAGKV